MFFKLPLKVYLKKVLHCIVSIMQAGAIFSNIQALCRYLSIYTKTIFTNGNDSGLWIPLWFGSIIIFQQLLVSTWRQAGVITGNNNHNGSVTQSISLF